MTMCDACGINRADRRPGGPVSLLLAAAAAGLLWLSFAQAWWNPIQDPDVFWQLWAGRQMLAGEFPRTNTFSWTAPDTPWVPHEPLVALSYAAAGLEHVGLLRGIVVSLSAGMLAVLAWRREAAWATLFALCGCLVLVIYGRSERALSWGNLVLAAIACLVYRVPARHRWRMPLAAALVGVWANVHGSFVLGVLMLGLVHWRWGPLAAGLCLFNPSGWKLYALVLGYGVGHEAQAFVHQAIPEWYPLDLTTPLGWLRLICLLAAGYLLMRDRQWRWVVLWALVGILAVRHQRFFDVLCIALLAPVTDALARRLPARQIAHPAPLLAAAMFVTAIVSPRPAVDATMYPDPLLHDLPREARLWNEFHLGGWLGYHGRRCYWDPRNDCYPPDVLQDGLRIAKRWPGWGEALERRRIEAVLASDAALLAALEADGWTATASHEGFKLLRPPHPVSRAASAPSSAPDERGSSARPAGTQ
ncbi:MAG: hypothetical protein AB1601_02795 [Planctomycetota bacterium]